MCGTPEEHPTPKLMDYLGALSAVYRLRGGVHLGPHYRTFYCGWHGGLLSELPREGSEV